MTFVGSHLGPNCLRKLADDKIKKSLESKELIGYQRKYNGVARTLKKLWTYKGDYCIKQWFSTITSLFKRGTSLKGKNLLREGVNSFL